MRSPSVSSTAQASLPQLTRENMKLAIDLLASVDGLYLRAECMGYSPTKNRVALLQVAARAMILLALDERDRGGDALREAGQARRGRGLGDQAR